MSTNNRLGNYRSLWIVAILCIGADAARTQTPLERLERQVGEDNQSHPARGPQPPPTDLEAGLDPAVARHIADLRQQIEDLEQRVRGLEQRLLELTKSPPPVAEPAP